MHHDHLVHIIWIVLKGLWRKSIDTSVRLLLILHLCLIQLYFFMPVAKDFTWLFSILLTNFVRSTEVIGFVQTKAKLLLSRFDRQFPISYFDISL